MNPCGRCERPTFIDVGNTQAYFGTGFGDGTKVVDQVSLSHADTGITDTEEFVLLVSTDTDVELLLRVKDRRIRQRRVADLVQGI